MGVLDRFRLDGRVAVVTGAGTGLGVAFATALAEAGADLVLGARRVEQLRNTERLVGAVGRRALVVQTDVSVPSECDRLVERSMSEFGRVDILVNNAAIGPAVPAMVEKPDHFRQVLEINLCGCYWMAQSCAREMKPGSSIVNISSAIALTTAGMPQAAYSASKAGLLGLTRDLAQEWTGRYGIRVNAIAPGWFITEMTKDGPPPSLWSGSDDPHDYLKLQANRAFLRRMGEPSELASTLVWLASDAASYVTGQTIVVDGGYTLA